MEKEQNSTSIVLVEVALAIGLYFAAKALFLELGFGPWQQSLFGSAPLTSLSVFFLIPLVFALFLSLRPAEIGLSVEGWGWSTVKALQAAMFVLPATCLFPVVSALGQSAFGWTGAAILAAGFLGAGLLFLFVDRRSPPFRPQGAGGLGLAIYVVLFGAGLAAMHALYPVSPLAARILGVFLFVAFLEEIFFRGYLQSRLDAGFGKPFSVFGVDFGMGLILASIAFGLFHPLSAAGAPPWPWALWTAAFGLILGLLREKTGSVWTPGLLHGLILVPSVFAGPAS
jgi:membrane protease YdiL (CAAX protease family)